MATIRIKQGDQYAVPVLIRLNGEPVDIDEVAEAEFTLGDGLRKLYSDMKGMTYRERIDRYSLKPDRADVIIPAAELFLTAADALQCKNIRVPNISLADCIIDSLYKRIRESPIR